MPNLIDHCIEWARGLLFADLFVDLPQIATELAEKREVTYSSPELALFLVCVWGGLVEGLLRALAALAARSLKLSPSLYPSPPQKYGDSIRAEVGTDPILIHKRLPKLRLLFEYLDLATGAAGLGQGVVLAIPLCLGGFSTPSPTPLPPPPFPHPWTPVVNGHN
jgi:hypothetical protein